MTAPIIAMVLKANEKPAWYASSSAARAVDAESGAPLLAREGGGDKS